MDMAQDLLAWPPSLVAVIRPAYWTLDHSARAVPLGSQSYAAYQQANAGRNQLALGCRRRLFHGDQDDIFPRISRVLKQAMPKSPSPTTPRPRRARWFRAGLDAGAPGHAGVTAGVVLDVGPMGARVRDD